MGPRHASYNRDNSLKVQPLGKANERMAFQAIYIAAHPDLISFFPDGCSKTTVLDVCDAKQSPEPVETGLRSDDCGLVRRLERRQRGAPGCEKPKFHRFDIVPTFADPPNRRRYADIEVRCVLNHRRQSGTC